MDRPVGPRSPWWRPRQGGLFAACGAALLVAGVLLGRWWFAPQAPPPQAPPQPNQDQQQAEPTFETLTHITVPQTKLAAAGVRAEKLSRRSVQEQVWVTGKITLNEDRVAHVHPLVEGRVFRVEVHFGQDVKAGQVLAIIDSPEVGEAKLAYVRNRLAAQIARVNHEWAETINRNTQELIRAIRQEVPVAELDQRFHGRPMGEYRAQLVTAYANLHKARIDYERVKTLTTVVRGKDILAAKTELERAQAILKALLEQTAFSALQKALKAKQELDRAQAALAESRARLHILGYSDQELASLDPAAEGRAVAHYAVRAPFDATVISKDVVVDERVGPNTQMFRLADLSTLWVQADIYQKHLPLVRGLKGKQVRFRAPPDDQEYQATVFFTGELLDANTRTLRLVARVNNSQRLLKPGMFVQVGLPAQVREGVLLIPAQAVQEYQGHRFVFVQVGPQRFQRRLVKVGPENKGLVEVLSGLKEGEAVVVQGAFALKSELVRELGGIEAEE